MEIGFCKTVGDILTSKLNLLNIYVTNRCNSRCLICGIWKDLPKVDMNINLLKKLLNDRIAKKAQFCLQGGEFFLHPDYDKILKLFRGKKFFVETNGILDKIVIESIIEYDIPSLYISLDGDMDTYKRIRGVDAYNNVLNVISTCSKLCSVTIGFTMTPYNDYNDLIHVAEIAKKFKCNLWLNIFGSPPHFKINNFYDQTMAHSHFQLASLSPLVSKNDQNYIRAYLKGLTLPCLSTRIYSTILPNGDVLFCQGLNITLGNIKDTTFRDVWFSRKRFSLLRATHNCQRCALSCHRKLDATILFNLQKFLPANLSLKLLKEIAQIHLKSYSANA
ncbi:MAG: radical SAM/SPASM domain-containing protein [Candidatus Bathyarchaeales archaeon]